MYEKCDTREEKHKKYYDIKIIINIYSILYINIKLKLGLELLWSISSFACGWNCLCPPSVNGTSKSFFSSLLK